MKTGPKSASVSKKREKGGMKQTGGNTRKSPKTASRKRSLSKDTSNPKQGRKRTKERQNDDETLPFRNVRLRPNVYAKWTPLSKTTEAFVAKVLETNVTHAMNKSSKADLETTQDTLNDLQATLVRAVRGMKVPRPAVTNYKQLQANTAILERQLQQNTNQIQILEEALEEEEELTTALEQELGDLEDAASGGLTPTPRKHKLHPFLRSSFLEDLSVPEMMLSDETRSGRPNPNNKDHFDALTAQVAAIGDELTTTTNYI